jgi:TM2 domain-containing membrane protein YozV
LKINKTKYFIITLLFGFLGVHKIVSKQYLWAVGYPIVSIFYPKIMVAMIVLDLVVIYLLRADENKDIDLTQIKF